MHEANALIDDGLIRPVLWKTMAFDQVAEAHQLMHENKHAGKISILVGATEEGQGKTADGPGRDHRGGRRLMAGGFVHIPWYATALRGDKLEAVLLDIGRRAALRRDRWQVHRSRDDRYKLLQIVAFDSKEDFERWWAGREMVDMRVITSGWWQVPVLYVWHDLCGAGEIGDGNGNGVPEPAPEPSADVVA